MRWWCYNIVRKNNILKLLSLLNLIYTLYLLFPLNVFIHTDVIPNTAPYYYTISLSWNIFTADSSGTTDSSGITRIQHICHGCPPSVVYNILCHKSNMSLMIAHSPTVFCLPKMYVPIICISIDLSMSNEYGYTHIPLSDIWGIIYSIPMANPTCSIYRFMHMVAVSTHVYYPYRRKYCTDYWKNIPYVFAYATTIHRNIPRNPQHLLSFYIFEYSSG